MEDEDDRKPPAKRNFVSMEDEDDCKPPAKCSFVEKKNIPNINATKKTRQDKYNKRFSQQKNKEMKMSLKEEMHDDFFQDNMAKEFYTTKSPHILITRTFRHIQENSIILECPVVENEQKNSRTIFYKIKYFGKNIMFKKKKIQPPS